MKYGKIIKGNFTIKKGCKDDFSEVEKITGYLSVEAENTQLPQLSSVGGDLYVRAENTQLPQLSSVGGGLYVRAENTQLPQLSSVGGDLYVRAENTQLPQLSSVGGDLSVEAENTQLPQLSSVGGGLYVEAENTQLPQLSSVGGDLYVRAENTQLPQLSSVGGGLSVEAENTQLPQLSSVGGDLYVRAGIKLESKNIKFNDSSVRQIALKFNFECFLKAGFLFADRILAKIISKRKNANNTVYKVQICGQVKLSYCVEVVNLDGTRTFAHGDTIKQAKADLKYKFQNRDTSMYKDYTLDTVVSFEDAIQMYHDITGACSTGTKHFCENILKVKKKKYTIKECIELTKGQYNSEMFEKFFTAKV